MERAVDTDLFLEAQGHWAEDSPHCLVILHEMFLHAASEGQKEVEQVLHWACQQHMPQLDPKADTPTIQLVHPDMSRRDILSLYLEVYKLHWLPGSPGGELALFQEFSSALPGLSLNEGATSNVTRQSSPGPSCPPQGGPSHQGRASSLDHSLARVHQAHQSASSAMAALEEEIERLHWMKVHPSSGQRNMDKGNPKLGRKRQRQLSFSVQPPSHRSAISNMPSGGTGPEGRESDLGEPPQLEAEVASFLQGSLGASLAEDEVMPPEPPISWSAEWVCWRAGSCDTPARGTKLSMVQEVDIKQLAQEVRALFYHPKQMHELNPLEVPFQVPPAPPCLCQQRFMPPATSIYASWDIREIPCEKVIAHIRAYSTTGNKITCQGRVNHAFWWKV